MGPFWYGIYTVVTLFVAPATLIQSGQPAWRPAIFLLRLDSIVGLNPSPRLIVKLVLEANERSQQGTSKLQTPSLILLHLPPAAWRTRFFALLNSGDCGADLKGFGSAITGDACTGVLHSGGMG